LVNLLVEADPTGPIANAVSRTSPKMSPSSIKNKSLRLDQINESGVMEFDARGTGGSFHVAPLQLS